MKKRSNIENEEERFKRKNSFIDKSKNKNKRNE